MNRSGVSITGKQPMLPSSACTSKFGSPAPPESRKCTGPSRSTTLWRTASILRQDTPRQTHENLDHRGGRSATVLVQAIEGIERGQDRKHVFGLLHRAPRAQLIRDRDP